MPPVGVGLAGVMAGSTGVAGAVSGSGFIPSVALGCE